MTERQNGKALALIGASHFLVDFLCTALLTASVAGSAYPRSAIVLFAVVYNGLAFAFQAPIGALADRLRLTRSIAAFGCVLVAAGILIPAPIAMCIVIGVGNACFHVGGGREALKLGEGKAGPVGRFVAPGAVGIFLGPRCAAVTLITRAAAPLLLCAAAFLLLRTRRTETETLEPAPLTMSRGRLVAVMTCMFLTVLLRSYIGTALHYSFASVFVFAALFTLCIFAGKFTGGLFADRFGALRFSAVAQPVCVLLLLLSLRWQWAAMPAILLFNTTMAITAAELYRCAPASPGATFGLTTLALYLGILPKLLGRTPPAVSFRSLLALGVASAALLLAGLRLAEGRKHG